MKDSSLYIHVPYCATKCIYCDFYSGGVRRVDWDRFADSVGNEFKHRSKELKTCPDTLYIGGGTPSLMPGDVLLKLVDNINTGLKKGVGWKEFTVEANPDDVTEEKCESWVKAGVNRISMGVQSFIDDELHAIKRRHDSHTALRAFNVLQRYFENVSIDLMYGIPGQRVESWETTVKTAVSLKPNHISAYSLMLEEGTALTILHNQGKIELPGEDDCLKMWRLLSEELKRNGYRQYEISNYCLPGCESVHNSRYWNGNPYLGLGPSAHSYDGHKIRRSNPADIAGYINRYSTHETSGLFAPYKYKEEKLSDEELIEEHILTRMRVADGINLTQFKDVFGSDKYDNLLRNALPYVRDGRLEVNNNQMHLTQRGIMTADQIIVGLAM